MHQNSCRPKGDEDALSGKRGVETYRALGASRVTISVGEVLSSLQVGVVNGFDNTPIITQAWGESGNQVFLKYSSYLPTCSNHYEQGWFDSLTPEQQKIMRDNAQKLENKGRKMVRGLEPALMKTLITKIKFVT